MVYVNIAVGCAVVISVGFLILAICSLCDLALSVYQAKMQGHAEEAEPDKGEDGVC